MISFCIFSFILAGESKATDLSKLEFLTEAYPPYNYIKDGKLQGFAVDLLTASMASLSEPFDIEEIKRLLSIRNLNEYLGIFYLYLFLKFGHLYGVLLNGPDIKYSTAIFSDIFGNR